jgi:hypothetical protein
MVHFIITYSFSSVKPPRASCTPPACWRGAGRGVDDAAVFPLHEGDVVDDAAYRRELVRRLRREAGLEVQSSLNDIGH